MLKRVMAKLGTMRKETDWVVYPFKEGDTEIIIQSDKRICQFDRTTGVGRLSKSCTNPGFIMLNQILGAVEITVPQDVIDAAINAQPKSGDSIGPGIVVG